MEQRWISVSERLPEKGAQVLCCNKYGSVFTSCITAKIKKSFYFGKHYDVVAWMPLPEPYQVGAENAHTKKLQTNADRIRNMTDEELTKYLPMVSDFICQPTEECIKNTITYCGECEKTEECAMKWLRAESEE